MASTWRIFDGSRRCHRRHFQSDCQPRKLCKNATCLCIGEVFAVTRRCFALKQFVRGAEKADEFGQTTSFVARGEMNPVMRADEEADGLCGTTNCVARGEVNPAVVGFLPEAGLHWTHTDAVRSCC